MACGWANSFAQSHIKKCGTLKRAGNWAGFVDELREPSISKDTHDREICVRTSSCRTIMSGSVEK